MRVRHSYPSHGGQWLASLPMVSKEGGLAWCPVSFNVQVTTLLLACYYFGDLKSYHSISRASRQWNERLAWAMRCIRNTITGLYWMSTRRCGICGPYEMSHGKLQSCKYCDTHVCELCLLMPGGSFRCAPNARDQGSSTAICTWCEEEAKLEHVLSMRTWFLDEIEANIENIRKDYDSPFYVQLLSLSGSTVCDEQRKPLDVLHTTWSMPFEQLWRDLYAATGGRILQFIVDDKHIDWTSHRNTKWSHLISRPVARSYSQKQPLQITVILRD